MAPYETERLAAAAFSGVLFHAFGHPQEGTRPHWAIKDEPVLRWAFERGTQLGNALAELDAQRAKDEQQRSEAVARLDASTPAASELLAILETGKPIELCGHSLQWDAELSMLWGTNAYGIDYGWSDMTLEGVEQWRTLLINGRTIGLHPDEPPLSALPQLEDEIMRELDRLAKMDGLEFSSDYSTVYPSPESAL